MPRAKPGRSQWPQTGDRGDLYKRCLRFVFARRLTIRFFQKSNSNMARQAVAELSPTAQNNTPKPPCSSPSVGNSGQCPDMSGSLFGSAWTLELSNMIFPIVIDAEILISANDCFRRRIGEEPGSIRWSFQMLFKNEKNKKPSILFPLQTNYDISGRYVDIAQTVNFAISNAWKYVWRE